MCPTCRNEGRAFRPAALIGADIAATKRWFRDRARKENVPALQLMHDEAAEVWRCSCCGTLWRADPDLWSRAVEDYEHDRYPPNTLPLTHRADRQDALDNHDFFARSGVRPGARVLEIACYAGGFLAAAKLLGAAALGFDPNPQLVEYCRTLGLTAFTGTIDDAARVGEVDVLVVLNCFDQLPEPMAFLGTAARIVRPGGSIVIRTPNADFATAAHQPDASKELREVARRHLVLGMPFLVCYSPRALDSMLRAAGFGAVAIGAKPTDGIDAAACGAPWLQVSARRRPEEDAARADACRVSAN
jgi:2-polyprenyl-3-methyl-5-hydroxy-6-metoxy-1,4-benzoquinol methylase